MTVGAMKEGETLAGLLERVIRQTRSRIVENQGTDQGPIVVVHEADAVILLAAAQSTLERLRS